jgi:hypothetical protein
VIHVVPKPLASRRRRQRAHARPAIPSQLGSRNHITRAIPAPPQPPSCGGQWYALIEQLRADMTEALPLAGDWLHWIAMLQSGRPGPRRLSAADPAR